MDPKPVHLGPEYGAQFSDVAVAGAYSTRPPYPAEFFQGLEDLFPDGSRVLLDLGCGTGDVAISMAERVDRVDAVDPSAAMLAVARSRKGADHPSIRWIHAPAERFEFRGPYSLVLAAESLHWMDWGTVLARIAAALEPRGFLVLADGRALVNMPWASELEKLIPKYSTNRDYRPYDLVAELTRRGAFREVGRSTTRCVPFDQPLVDYIESFHTRNGFSRERMIRERAAEFDQAVRTLVLPYCPSGVIHGETCAVLIWGSPSAV